MFVPDSSDAVHTVPLLSKFLKRRREAHITMTRTFVRVRDCALATGQKEKTIYEQIRTGIFPFRIKRAGRTILISAADLELISPEGPQSNEALIQNQNEKFAATV